MGKPDGFANPYILKHSYASNFAAGDTALRDQEWVEARYRIEDTRMTTTSVPQGSIEFRGNISPKAERQQGVVIRLDSSDFGSILDLMMACNKRRTIEAISKALSSHARRLPEGP